MQSSQEVQDISKGAIVGIKVIKGENNVKYKRRTNRPHLADLNSPNIQNKTTRI